MAPKTKANSKRLEATVQAFHARYSDASQIGESRWNSSLYQTLALPTEYSALINQYCVDDEEGKAVLSTAEGAPLERIGFPPCTESGVLSIDDDTGTDGATAIICYKRGSPPTTLVESNGETETTVVHSPSATPFPIPRSLPSSASHLLTHWNMDAASVLAAHMLDVSPGDRVLDMCAAPGGKSVVLAQKLFPHLYRHPPSSLPAQDILKRSSLHANEFDSTRYKRLSANLKSYLPESLFPTSENPTAPIRVLNKDLSAKISVSFLPFGAGGYDKVLIDAPCSSERHIIHAHEKATQSGQIADEMLNWKSSHVATLVKTQTGLLQTALKAVKIGGRILYATCALGTEENDGVVEKVLDNLRSERKKAKRDGQTRENWEAQILFGSNGTYLGHEDSILEAMTESTKYGRIALPDHGTWGPLYFCVIVKVEKIRKIQKGGVKSNSHKEDDGLHRNANPAKEDNLSDETQQMQFSEANTSSSFKPVD